MFRKKLDWVTQTKHHDIAVKFVDRVICQTCVEAEGLCKVRRKEAAYKNCGHFHNAVREVKKVLDKYNK